MVDSTYKKIEIVGTSNESVTEAIGNGIRKAAKTVDEMSWFEVVEIRGRIEDDDVAEVQVTMKLGLKVH